MSTKFDTFAVHSIQLNALVLIIVVCIPAIFCNNSLNPHRLVLIGVYVDTPQRI